MDLLIPKRLATLGHPQRLAVFRLLMRRHPDRVPATELALALDLKPNTLSNYVNALMQTGLVSQEREGTSLRYAIDMDVARQTIDYLLLDCCRSRPEICAPSYGTSSVSAAHRPYNVLFLCTGNSARSIFAEAILRQIAGDRFHAFSAGTHPQPSINPITREVLQHNGYDTATLTSKHLSIFQGPDAPVFDFVFTVCDAAANEDCPAWPNQPVTAHWGLPDPVRVTGTHAQQISAFRQVFDALVQRLRRFADLPFTSFDPVSLQRAIDDLARLETKETV
ncbi:helix-turn-helix domain-containing protein [Yoonia algicola]|uniref:Helix-turn-helix domain-containing protein n=1 Tax=Yoonia algicola TaxID=3137368 RepID=A0AAN0M729_9RHOB